LSSFCSPRGLACRCSEKSDEKWGGQADYEAYKRRTPIMFPLGVTCGAPDAKPKADKTVAAVVGKKAREFKYMSKSCGALCDLQRLSTFAIVSSYLLVFK
jgi:hypothetical protein